MQPEHYIHPEFGLLAPTPRLKHELRIACFSLLFGITLGVVAMTSIRLDRSGDGTVASPAVAAGLAAASPTTPIPIVAEHSGAGSIGADAPAAVQIGRHVGNSDPGCDGDRFSCAKGAARNQDSERPPTSDQSAVASPPVDGARASTGVYPADRPVDRKVEPYSGSATADPVPDAKPNFPETAGLPSPRKARNTPQQTRPHLGPQRPNAKEDRSRIGADRTSGAESDGRVDRDYARNSSSRRLGFWDWAP
jgi:hypothetical protein